MENFGRRGFFKMFAATAAVGGVEKVSSAEARELTSEEVSRVREGMRTLLREIAGYFKQLHTVDIRGDIKGPMLRYEHVIDELTDPEAHIDLTLPGSDPDERMVIGPLFSGEPFYNNPQDFSRHLQRASDKLKTLLLHLGRSQLPDDLRKQSDALIKKLDDERSAIATLKASKTG